MGRTNRSVDESIVVVGSSVSTAIERVRAAAERTSGCVVTSPAPDVVQVARTVRSMIGRKTQICTLRASNEPHGLVVSINGPIDAALLSAIRDSLSAKDTTDELTVTTFAPPPATVVSPSHFQPPTDWFVGAELDGGDTALTQHRNDFAPPAGTTTRGGAVLQLQDGRRFALAPRMLLGRDPAPRDDADTGAILVVIADDAISKTHLAMGRQGDAVWVEDRRSTNGTMLLDGLGRQVSLASGQRSVFGLPMTIVIGDTTASISAKL